MGFTQFSPTTTVSALTKNNTSAADAFLGFDNGTPGAGNVSKVPRRYSKSNVKRIVHRVDWFVPGSTSHKDVGYSVLDPLYIASTVRDMIERGYDACMLDWHGAGSIMDKSALLMKAECERQGLKFGIVVGGEIVKNKLDPTGIEIAALDYVRDTFLSSAAYFTFNGRPVIHFFGGANVNWTALRTHVDTFPVKPSLWYRWEETYGAHAAFDGFYGWTQCTPTWYKDVVAKVGGRLVCGSMNPRFNNVINGKRVWGDHDIKISGDNGLRMAKQLTYFNDAAALYPNVVMIMDVTWNDHEEGTGIEVGVEGITISGSIQDNRLVVNATPAAVLDHFELYAVGSDGRAMYLDSTPSGSGGVYNLTNYSFDLIKLDLQPGAYTFVVKAVGIHSMRNVLSAAVPAAVSMSVAAAVGA
jgi:hypothetical protein